MFDSQGRDDMQVASPSRDYTVRFIRKAHEGQTDKAGNPYHEHPEAVACLVQEQGGSEVEILAALLHDVVEDTEYTLSDLLKVGYPQEIVDIVEVLTREEPRTSTYAEYIKQIAKSGNASAMRVKLADLQHNSLPARLSAIPSPTRQTLAERYSRARKFLEKSLRKAGNL